MPLSMSFINWHFEQNYLLVMNNKKRIFSQYLYHFDIGMVDKPNNWQSNLKFMINRPQQF